MRNFAADPPIEERVAEALGETDASVAIAETCTGGAISTLLTDVPGSSEYFDRGFVPYARDSFRETLGIDREALDEHGIVSEPVTAMLARRARDMAKATWGVATNGIAGPSGGAEDRPVGTTYVGIAYAGPWESETSFSSAERKVFEESGRLEVRERMARGALESLLAAIESTPRA